MIKRTTKLRWRRRFKRSQQQVENLSQQVEKKLDKHLFHRLTRLNDVRRFVLAWLSLVVLLSVGVALQNRALSRYYQALQPVDGGIFTEGIAGAFTTANPVYATGSVDTSVSKLVFAGLMKYDSNGKLVGDLAESIKANSTGNTYTVTLKQDLQWHDDKPLTAKDVVFTYKVIQHADAKSPLRPNWQGIKIEAKNERVVQFILPHPLASFPHSLTTGIIPQHLLDNIPLPQLRNISFNTVAPIGSGPFKWESLQVQGQTPEDREEQITLIANEKFHSGKPQLDRFIIRAVHNQDRLKKLFTDRQLTAVAGLDELPEGLENNVAIKEYSIPINGQVNVFFKTTEKVLKDRNVREALIRATDTYEIIRGLGYPVIASNQPLLKIHTGYNKKRAQYSPNIERAKFLLKKAGWQPGEDGILIKNGQRLSFRMYAHNTNEFAHVTQTLQRQWRRVGVDAEVILQSAEDLQTTIAFHSYDVLVNGITLGSDPDVYAYWHSSQADLRSPNRLNFSEYKSSDADFALEAGRARINPNQRYIKLQPFLSAWRKDVPAIALYQPRFLYLTFGAVHGFEPTHMNTPTDRYANVERWQIRTKRVTIE